METSGLAAGVASWAATVLEPTARVVVRCERSDRREMRCPGPMAPPLAGPGSVRSRHPMARAEARDALAVTLGHVFVALVGPVVPRRDVSPDPGEPRLAGQ